MGAHLGDPLDACKICNTSNSIDQNNEHVNVMCVKNLAKRLTEEVENVSGGVTAIAKHLGKTRNTIYNWCEKGNIPADQLLLLAGIGVDIQYVITGARSAPSKDELSPQEGVLIEKFRLLSDSDKAHSQAVVGAFADKGSDVKKKAKPKEC